jgi:hypothetical protein
MSMVSSESIDPKPRSRSQLFFGRYPYCMSADLLEASVLRHRDHAWIDSVIPRRQDWGRRLISQPGSWRWQRPEIDQQGIDNLHAVLRWIEDHEYGVKTTVTGQSIWIYCDDLDLARRAAALPGMCSPVITEVVLQGTPGAINLRRSQYQQRTYLRCRAITAEQKQRLRDLLAHQTDIRIGSGLALWLENPNLHVREYFFVDHDHANLTTLLELAVGRLVRKTMPIVTDK